MSDIQMTVTLKAADGVKRLATQLELAPLNPIKIINWSSRDYIMHNEHGARTTKEYTKKAHFFFSRRLPVH